MSHLVHRLCAPALGVTLLVVSCRFESVPVAPVLDVVPLKPDVVDLVKGGRVTVHLSGIAFFSEGRFELQETQRVSLRIKDRTQADFDTYVDLVPSPGSAEGTSSMVVRRFSFRWNQDLEISTNEKLHQGGFLSMARGWGALRSLEIARPQELAGASESPELTLGQLLAANITRAVVEQTGEGFQADRRLVRAIYLTEGEVTTRKAPGKVVLELDWPSQPFAGFSPRPAAPPLRPATPPPRPEAPPPRPAASPPRPADPSPVLVPLPPMPSPF